MGSFVYFLLHHIKRSNRIFDDVNTTGGIIVGQLFHLLWSFLSNFPLKFISNCLDLDPFFNCGLQNGEFSNDIILSAFIRWYSYILKDFSSLTTWLLKCNSKSEVKINAWLFFLAYQSSEELFHAGNLQTWLMKISCFFYFLCIIINSWILILIHLSIAIVFLLDTPTVATLARRYCYKLAFFSFWANTNNFQNFLDFGSNSVLGSSYTFPFPHPKSTISSRNHYSFFRSNI